MMVEFQCEFCDKLVVIYRSDSENQIRRGYGARRFCSQKCYHTSVKNREIPKERACTTCNQVKPFDRKHFGCRRGKGLGGILSVCKKCLSEEAKVTGKAYRDALRITVLTAYAEGELKCVCCGERNHEFLCLDHIHGGGSQERKTITMDKLFRRLRREGFPKGMYRTLCLNCNWAYAHYGRCPHQSLQPEE